ncbi:hypothetical protein ACJ73_02465 [Blastomyces percursus]|uniref:Uncharacterized protein n=1 Tax=Blastomyces percursus TaxID=1658174 RepID=A0A1J9R174_9EURO|nr:hypothetical protein ACJ73_02465 [Blastomyces percursus]
MENKRRLFGFHGDDTEYIKFLESKLLSVERQLCFQTSTLSTSNPISSSNSRKRKTPPDHITNPGGNETTLSPPSTSTLSASNFQRNDTPSSHPSSPRDDEAVLCLQTLASDLIPPSSSFQKNSTAQALEFVYYNPVPDCPGKKQKLSNATPQWKTDANKFLASIPTMDKWDERRKERGFYTVKENQVAIQILLGKSPVEDGTRWDVATPELPTLNPIDNRKMIFDGCRYGSLSIKAELNAVFHVLLSKYQQLIFVNYCIILLCMGNSVDTVDWMMRRYISDSGSRNLKRYRLGCVFVNRCITSLLKQGWGHKSWEIFIICAQSPHLYARFVDAPNECHKILTERLGTANVPLWEDRLIPFCIPSIIKVWVGDDIEMSQICSYLGYDFDLITQIHHTFISRLNTDGQGQLVVNDTSNAASQIEYTNSTLSASCFGQTISDTRISPSRHVNNGSDSGVALQNDLYSSLDLSDTDRALQDNYFLPSWSDTDIALQNSEFCFDNWGLTRSI